MGYDNTVVLRDGLQRWIDDGLPYAGDNRFPFIEGAYLFLPHAMVYNPKILKVDFTAEGDLNQSFPNVRKLYTEHCTDREVRDFMKELNGEAIILLTLTYSEEYDAVCFGKLYEKAGGTVLGYYSVRGN